MPETKQEETALEVVPRRQMSRVSSYTPTTFQEATQFAKLIANSDLAPKDYQKKPANILVAMQLGAELGLAPLQALQNVAVINGRPSLWGDAALGVVQRHPDYEWHNEMLEGEGDNRVGVFEIKRRGQDPHKSTFSVVDAKRAQLWGKSGPWTQYPDRMLKLRARGFGLRDKFADALRGLVLAEEAMDTPVERPQKVTGILDADVLSILSPGIEPNRGHGNEGMQRQLVSENGKCTSCGASGGHLPSCVHRKASEATQTPAEAPSAPSGPSTAPSGDVSQEPKPKTTRRVVFVQKVTPKTKRSGNKERVYHLLSCTTAQEEQYDVFCWHESLAPLVLTMQGKEVEVSVSRTEKDNNVYCALEQVHRIGEQEYVDGKAVEAKGLPLDWEK